MEYFLVQNLFFVSVKSALLFILRFSIGWRVDRTSTSSPCPSEKHRDA